MDISKEALNTVKQGKEAQINVSGQGTASVNNPVNKTKIIKLPNISPETTRKIKILKAKGVSNTKIAKQTNASRPTVIKLVNNPEVKESIEVIKRRLADKAAVIAEHSLDSMSLDDINNSSVVQKATVFGIMADKYVDLTADEANLTGENPLLTGLKGKDLISFVNSGGTVKIGIVLDAGNKTVTPVEKVDLNAPIKQNE